MDRRMLIGGLAAGAAAMASPAWAATQTVKLTQAFAFLETYYGLAAGRRDRFRMAFFAVRNRRFAPDLKATIVAGGKRTPLALGRDGFVEQLPSLAELKSSATLEFDAAPADRVGLALSLEPDMPPAAHLDARALAAAIAQAEAAVASLAGMLSFAAPKIAVAMFPGAGSGQAELDSGRAVPLPVNANPFWGSAPFYEPATLAGARTIVLARAPSRILLGQHPK